MHAVRVAIGDEAVETLDPQGQVRGHEQVQDPVDAVGYDAALQTRGHALGDIVGAGRVIESRQFLEHSRPHVGPLLAGSQDRLSGSIGQRRAAIIHMIVLRLRHASHMGRPTLRLKPQEPAVSVMR